MSRNTTISLLALIQFVGLIQIFAGLVIVPGLMHSGDSAVLDPIADARLRTRVANWHDREIRFVSRVLTGFGVATLVLGGVATWVVSRTTEGAQEGLRAFVEKRRPE